MTPQEKKTLDFIRDKIIKTGVAPTYAEIAAEFGLKAKSGGARRVESLIRQGYLVRRPRANRGIELNTSALSHVPTAALQAELDRREQGAGQ